MLSFLPFILIYLPINQAQTASALPSPMAIVDRALQAGGGVEKIGKFGALTAKADGKMMDADFTVTAAFLRLDKIRFEMSAPATMVMMFDHDKGWVKLRDTATHELPADEVSAMREFFIAMSLPDLLLTLKGKDCTLETIGEQKIESTEAIGIRVTRANKKEFQVFFAKETGLPIKTRVLLPSKTGDEQWCEFSFSDYKEVEGVKHFTRMKITQGGDEVGEFTIKEIKLLKDLDADEFKAP
jgi:hypothetical protein